MGRASCPVLQVCLARSTIEMLAGCSIIFDVASKRKTRRVTDEISETAPVVPDSQHERPRSKRKKAIGPRFNPVNAAEGDSVAPSSPENYI